MTEAADFDQGVPIRYGTNEVWLKASLQRAGAKNVNLISRRVFIFQELEKSKFATQALDLSKMQEQTRQQEQQTKIKEYEAAMEQMKIDQKRVEGEQKRKYMEEEAKIAKNKAEYQDQLARRRYEDQLVQQQRMQEENLRKQEVKLGTASWPT